MLKLDASQKPHDEIESYIDHLYKKEKSRCRENSILIGLQKKNIMTNHDLRVLISIMEESKLRQVFIEAKF